MLGKSSMTRIKICCIKNREEATIAINAGASALGLVSEMPSGPGVISVEEIAAIAATIPNAIDTFLLTSSQNAAVIIEQQRLCGVNTLQLVDAQDDLTYGKLRDQLPGISLVQVIHVSGPESIEAACDVAHHVDAILLDSGNQSLPIKTLGGTGDVHDWSISSAIVSKVSIPVYLAGGLNAQNVAEAIRVVQPFGVDLCSGVRTDDRLDPEKLRNFMLAVSK